MHQIGIGSKKHQMHTYGSISLNKSKTCFTMASINSPVFQSRQMTAGMKCEVRHLHFGGRGATAADSNWEEQMRNLRPSYLKENNNNRWNLEK